MTSVSSTSTAPASHRRTSHAKPNTFEIIAAVMLGVLGSGAPWLLGSRVLLTWPIPVAICTALVAVTIVVIERLRSGRPMHVRPWLVFPWLLLLACLGWWALQEDPPFATAFAEQHWQFLDRQFFGSILFRERGERLGLLAAGLVILLTAAHLGRKILLRRILVGSIGLGGLTATLWTVGQRIEGWRTPAWVPPLAGVDRYAGVFFHHSAAAACFGVSALLVLAPGFRARWGWTLGAGLILTGLAIFCVPLWQAKSAYYIIAVSGGCLAAFLSLKHRLPLTWRQLWFGVVLALAGLVVAQLVLAHRANKRYPDGWTGAEETRLNSAVRDQQVEQRAYTRGDRLVVSGRPPREIAWIAALRMAADAPVVGAGPGAWVKMAVLYSNDPLMNTFYQHRQFAHNDLFQTAAEWGIVPLLAWLLIWGGALRHAAITCLESNYSEAGLLVALFALAVFSYLHFPLQVPALYLWMCVLLGVAWARPKPSKRPQGTR